MTAQPNPIAAPRIDWIPLALLGAVALGALAMIGNASTWVTLTIAGLAMGLTLPQTYFYVLLPMAFRIVVPPQISRIW